MTGYTLKIIFSGLIAFAPADNPATHQLDHMWVYAVRAELPEKEAVPPWIDHRLPLHPHHAVIKFQMKDADSSFKGEDTMIWPLRGEDIRIEGLKGSGTKKPLQRREDRNRASGTVGPQDFCLTADVARFAPGLALIDPVLVQPSLPADKGGILSGRLLLEHGTIGTGSLIQGHETGESEGPLRVTVPRLEGGLYERPFAADEVEWVIQGVRKPVRLVLTNFATKMRREIILRPSKKNGEVVLRIENSKDDALFGIQHVAPQVAPTQMFPFLWHYQLAARPGDVLKPVDLSSASPDPKVLVPEVHHPSVNSDPFCDDKPVFHLALGDSTSKACKAFGTDTP